MEVTHLGSPLLCCADGARLEGVKCKLVPNERSKGTCTASVALKHLVSTRSRGDLGETCSEVTGSVTT